MQVTPSHQAVMFWDLSGKLRSVLGILKVLVSMLTE